MPKVEVLVGAMGGFVKLGRLMLMQDLLASRYLRVAFGVIRGVAKG